MDQPVETPLVDLLITILRLLTAAVYQSTPDILVVSNLRGVHCVLTRLLPNPSLPPRAVKHALGLLYEILVVSPTEDQLLGLLDVLPSANIALRIEVGSFFYFFKDFIPFLFGTSKCTCRCYDSSVMSYAIPIGAGPSFANATALYVSFISWSFSMDAYHPATSLRQF